MITYDEMGRLPGPEYIAIVAATLAEAWLRLCTARNIPHNTHLGLSSLPDHPVVPYPSVNLFFTFLSTLLPPLSSNQLVESEFSLKFVLSFSCLKPTLV